ncbi:hypothetical protein DPMN_125277 [Dreissena polymorpha]|uniref:Wall-associated receptor kinase galacturonan-binding domain-containing protein n=1 Tax=Dreissena polymorpha TaxID=45954 RepID=A0A9D4JX12_DREPO|nr:hypothetical protein DPMN_125277 [Dreissena polymorpha]
MTGFLIVFLSSCGHGFLLDTNSDPCTYGSNTITCDNRKLTSIPVFNLTRFTDLRANLYIYLGNNGLPVLEAMHLFSFAP